MILRKPYAFFIKYFRVINFIIAVLMGILLYQTYALFKLFNTYVSDYTVIGIGFEISSYINFYSFLLPLIIIIGNIIVLSVLFIKKKPTKLYLLNLVVYLVTIIIFSISYSSLQSAITAILDVRVSKAMQDLTLFVFLAQVVCLIITSVRAIGFDIKSFDFKSDLENLEINEKDNEEIEVAIEFDKNKMKRKARYQLRNIRYAYVENKFFINIAIIVTLIVIAFTVYFNTSIYVANYKEDEYFSASGISMKINDSYLLQNDYSGSKLTNNNLVVIRFEVKRNSFYYKKLNTGLITLRVGNKSYSQTAAYNSRLADLGIGYVDQNLTDDYKDYILVFEIPNETNINNAKLKINDNISYVKGQMGAKNIFVKLKLEKIDKISKDYTNILGKVITFKDSILGSSTLEIKQISMGNKFKATYNFCASKTRCYESYEYITPTATGNYIKTLMKIDGNLKLDTNVLRVTTLTEFLNMFGSLQYQINGNVKTIKINSEVVKPKIAADSAYYIEIPREVLNADKINLIIKVRQISYIYTIK